MENNERSENSIVLQSVSSGDAAPYLDRIIELLGSGSPPEGFYEALLEYMETSARQDEEILGKLDKLLEDQQLQHDQMYEAVDVLLQDSGLPEDLPDVSEADADKIYMVSSGDIGSYMETLVEQTRREPLWTADINSFSITDGLLLCILVALVLALTFFRIIGGK